MIVCLSENYPQSQPLVKNCHFDVSPVLKLYIIRFQVTPSTCLVVSTSLNRIIKSTPLQNDVVNQNSPIGQESVTLSISQSHEHQKRIKEFTKLEVW